MIELERCYQFRVLGKRSQMGSRERVMISEDRKVLETIELNDRYTIIVQAEPQLTKNHGVTICTMVYDEESGDIFRIYPFLYSRDVLTKELRRWTVLSNLVVERRTQDRRPESRHLAQKEFEIIDSSIKKSQRKKIRQQLYDLRCNELPKDGRSVVIIKPSHYEVQVKKRLKNKYLEEVELCRKHRISDYTIRTHDLSLKLWNQAGDPLISRKPGSINGSGDQNAFRILDWGTVWGITQQLERWVPGCKRWPVNGLAPVFDLNRSEVRKVNEEIRNFAENALHLEKLLETEGSNETKCIILGNQNRRHHVWNIDSVL